MDTLYYLFGTLIFVAVALLLEGGFLVWNATRGPEALRVKRRLHLMDADGSAGARGTMIKQRMLSRSPGLDLLLRSLPKVDEADKLLLQSGLGWNVARLAGTSLVSLLAGVLLVLWTGLAWPAAIAAICAAAALPTLYVRRARNRRLEKIDLQLPEALDMMSRAMRAGHAFPTALKMVGDEMPAPLAEEFRTAFDEVNFGLSMHDALMNLASRVPSTDLRYFVIAVLIQRETGGNLSELLGNISALIRDRLKLMGEVRVLSAEGRMSAWILSLLPFGAALLIQLTNPQFLALLYTDPGGRKMVIGALGSMLSGVLAMRKIIRIRV